MAITTNEGSYIFSDVENGDYIIKAIPDTTENVLPTYYGNTELWNMATVINIANNLSVDSVDIIIIPLTSLDGDSFISGYVGEEGNGEQSIYKNFVNNPVPDVDVYLQFLQNTSWITVARTLTNIEGYFEFRNVPVGRHRIILDIPGLVMNNPQTIGIIPGDTITGIKYEITDNGIDNTTLSINSFVKEETNIRVYPNPAVSKLHVERSTQKTADYTIYNITGQIVLQGKLQKSSVINIGSLSKGMYYLRISDVTIKFLKQ